MKGTDGKNLLSPKKGQAISCDPEQARPAGRRLLLLWAIIRIPVLILALYLMRYAILLKLEQLFDLGRPTLFVIDLLGTLLVRVVYCLALAALLSLCFSTMRRYGPLTAYLSTLCLTIVLVTLSFYLTGTTKWLGLPAVVIVATNLLPVAFLTPIVRFKRIWGGFMGLGVGIVEVLFLGHYMDWLASRTGSTRKIRWLASSIVPTVASLFLAAGSAAALLGAPALVPLEQALRMPGEVRILARGDFNLLDIDPTGRYLYATGHGLDRLRRYDVEDWSSQPLKSDVSTGGAQGFAYDPAASELYVLNLKSKRLIYIDATTLKFKRSIPVPELSPGDPWVVVERNSDTITIASEVDLRTGSPLIVLNRTTGAAHDLRVEEVGNLLVHPTRSLLYFSFFRRNTGIMLYDIQKRAITRQVPTKERMDRMAIWKRSNELLITAPLDSRIIRFNADTLEPKGEIDSIFGVRVIAVDNLRNLLLCGSLATGKVAVVDLNSGHQKGSYYLGPWLRTIVLNEKNGTAYVSSNGALYEIQYVGTNGVITSRH